MSIPTFYNNSDFCPKCDGLMTPVEKLFSGSTGMCPACRNKEYAKQAKAAMGPRR